MQFSVGFDLTEPVRQAILAVPEQAWQPATDPDGHSRRGAWVAELTGLDLAGWPDGTRAICRRERPHPGARHKMAFTDAGGHRFQVFITNQADPDPARRAEYGVVGAGPPDRGDTPSTRQTKPRLRSRPTLRPQTSFQMDDACDPVRRDGVRTTVARDASTASA